MKKLIVSLAVLSMFLLPLSMAQTSARTTTSPTQQDQQAPLPDRPSQHIPDQSSPATTDKTVPNTAEQNLPTGTLADTQKRVQDALQREMPAGMGNAVQVNVFDDGSLQLSGTVSTPEQKQRAEDIARQSSSNQSIINKISVKSSQELNSTQSSVPK